MYVRGVPGNGHPYRDRYSVPTNPINSSNITVRRSDLLHCETPTLTNPHFKDIAWKMNPSISVTIGRPCPSDPLVCHWLSHDKTVAGPIAYR
jgi:hypothetical protein